jgi:hypothetical protein
VVGQQPDRFELVVVEQVGFVDDQHGITSAFGVERTRRFWELIKERPPGGVDGLDVPMK